MEGSKSISFTVPQLVTPVIFGASTIALINTALMTSSVIGMVVFTVAAIAHLIITLAAVKSGTSQQANYYSTTEEDNGNQYYYSVADKSLEYADSMYKMIQNLASILF